MVPDPPTASLEARVLGVTVSSCILDSCQSPAKSLCDTVKASVGCLPSGIKMFPVSEAPIVEIPLGGEALSEVEIFL